MNGLGWTRTDSNGLERTRTDLNGGCSGLRERMSRALISLFLSHSVFCFPLVSALSFLISHFSFLISSLLSSLFSPSLLRFFSPFPFFFFPCGVLEYLTPCLGPLRHPHHGPSPYSTPPPSPPTAYHLPAIVIHALVSAGVRVVHQCGILTMLIIH